MHLFRYNLLAFEVYVLDLLARSELWQMTATFRAKKNIPVKRAAANIFVMFATYSEEQNSPSYILRISTVSV